MGELQICKATLRGLRCEKRGCDFLHVKCNRPAVQNEVCRKNGVHTVCRNFLDTGLCPCGSRCPLLHLSRSHFGEGRRLSGVPPQTKHAGRAARRVAVPEPVRVASQLRGKLKTLNLRINAIRHVADVFSGGAKMNDMLAAFDKEEAALIGEIRRLSARVDKAIARCELVICDPGEEPGRCRHPSPGSATAMIAV